MSFSQVFIKRLVIGTKLYLSAKMSNSSETPKGLKDSKCKKGHLGIRPPIPYVPPTDLLQVKDSMEMLKVKNCLIGQSFL